MSKNKQVSQRTKHIDLRYHSLRDFTEKKNGKCEQGILIKVDGESNYADLMTKNTDGTTFKYLGDDIDNGLKRMREQYEKNIIQKLGGMSVTVNLEVSDDVTMVNHWIKYIKK